jgi:CBS domain-containing protein
MDAVRRSVVGVAPDRPISDTASIMDRSGVGALAVVDDDKLIGIVTDRDLVRRGLARRLPLDARIDSVMTTDVVTIDPDADLGAVFRLLHFHAIRRVMRDGRLVGMISIDDLIISLAANLADVARPITGGVLFGHHESPLTVRAGAL